MASASWAIAHDCDATNCINAKHDMQDISHDLLLTQNVAYHSLILARSHQSVASQVELS